MNILSLAREAWNAGADLRSRRQRFKAFTYGRQWDDTVVTPRGEIADEGSLAVRAGQHPLTNNMIRQLVKCVIGNFRSSLSSADPAASVSVDPETARRNSLRELDCRMLEEFLISGCAVQRVTMENRPGGCGVWVDNVNPRDFFVNSFCDPRGFDIELCGMLHSMSLREVLMRFSRGDDALRRRIEASYTASADSRIRSATGAYNSSPDFFTAPDGRCRVIEVWTLESRAVMRCHDRSTGAYGVVAASASAEIESENRRREAEGIPPVITRPCTTLRWHCRMLAPDGLVLDEFDSPYRHGLHPFAVKFFPLTDGEVHSFVEDIVDQQKHINRLITLIDHIMSVSAKGVLLFPAGQKLDSMSWADIADRWAKCDSIIPYDPRQSAHFPRQVVSGGENVGAYQLLGMQMNLMQQISGVTEALQGRITTPNASAALFDSQLRSSAIALLDLLDSFNSFRLQRNTLIVNS